MSTKLRLKKKKMHINEGGLPSSSAGKESDCNARDPGSRSGRSHGEGLGYPLQYSCLENPHGYSNLVGYSPWGGKALDMTE